MIELTHNGKRLTIGNWAKIRRIKPDTIRARKKRGYSDAVCLGYELPPRVNTLIPHDATLAKKRSSNPPETLTVQMTVIEIIDSVAVGRNAKRIRRAAGVTQANAGKQMNVGEYDKLERGERKWTEALIDRFNAVAAGWAVSNEPTNN